MPEDVSFEDWSWFEHEPLLDQSSSIRLLQILPDSVNTVRCIMEEHSLATNQKPQYTCLSYVWGTPESESSMSVIQINGASFRVRQNLYDFLICARSKPEYALTSWWIDAICMNQANSSEKSQQVQRMGQIYKDAEVVVSWLRYEPIDHRLLNDAEGFKSWLDLYRTINPHKSPRGFVDPPLRTPEADVRENRRKNDTWEFEEWYPQNRSLLTAELILLAHAARNNYWNRAWVVQELRLASKVLVWAAGMEIQLEALDALNRWAMTTIHHYELDYARNDFDKSWRELLTASPMQAFFSSEWRPWEVYSDGRFIDVLRDYSHTACEEYQDRIYSLRSLAAEGLDINVDYDRSRTSLLCECLWASKTNFCLCFAPVLMERLDLKHNPDNTMVALTTQPVADSPSPGRHLEQVYIEILLHDQRFSEAPLADLGPPNKYERYNLHLQSMTRCHCSHRAIPKHWKNHRGGVLCLGFADKVGPICGLSLGCQHLFFEELDGHYQAVEFARYQRPMEVPFMREELATFWAVHGFSLVPKHTRDHVMPFGTEKNFLMLRMTAPALMQLVTNFGSAPRSCWTPDIDDQYKILFKFEPEEAFSHVARD